LASETWWYTDEEQDFTVHFVKEGSWKQVNLLSDALLTHIEKDVAWQWMELVKERAADFPRYSEMATTIEIFEYKIESAVTAEGEGGGKTYELPFDFTHEILPGRPHKVITDEKYAMDIAERIDRRYAEPDVAVRYRDLKTLHMTAGLSQFRGEGGRTRLEVVTLTRIDDILEGRTALDTSDTVFVENQLVIRNTEFEPVRSVDFVQTVPLSAASQAGLPNVLSMQALQLAPVTGSVPATGDLTVQVTDAATRTKGFTQQPLAIRDFSGDMLMISDVQLYAGAAQSERRAIMPVSAINDMQVTPYPYLDVRKSEPVFCYFEIYNLHTLRPAVQYGIEIAARSTGERSWFRKLVDGLTGSDRLKLSISYTRQLSDNDAKELLALDVATLDSGEYTLEITITGAGSKSSAVHVKRNIVIKN